jgi:excinuclease ABC subunit B
VRIEFFGDEIERIYHPAPAHRRGVREEQEMYVFPATHYVAGPERMERAIGASSGAGAARRVRGQGKLLEAQRLRMRTSTTSR